MKLNRIASALLGSASAVILASNAFAANVNIPGGNLADALDAYTTQTGVSLIVSDGVTKGRHTHGAKGDLTADEALVRILKGTGLVPRQSSGAVMIVPAPLPSKSLRSERGASLHVASASSSSVETVVVTSSKIKGDIQTVPIAITALSQEQLTSRQIAGGPDLVKEVPNLTFSKTNFTGYNIEIRGIGTQAISVTTDPAVAVAFNDQPFIRNHFFEQEFYDVSQVEVLRGPQGTLYGRNATAGVVNVISAKPTDQFEAMLSADWGNYHNRRYEGMINIPIVDDRLGIRIAGEWTKRDGYAYNETTGHSIDGRDLWSSRVTVRFKPTDRLDASLIWEHFQEDDNRARSTKQLCKKDPGPSYVDGYEIDNLPVQTVYNQHINLTEYYQSFLSQGCLPTSLYSPDAFETPRGQANPIVLAGEFVFRTAHGFILNQVDPYASVTQPRNLRVIQSDVDPTYHAKNDVVEFNADFKWTPLLTLASQTGYNKDSLTSTEDFNRFNTAPGLFSTSFGDMSPAEFLANPAAYGSYAPVTQNGIYCDPQLGCSSKMVGADLSREHAWQFNQEIRLSSNFSGPLNFSLGANYTHYQTVEDYFVFLNIISALVQMANSSLPGDYTHCYPQTHFGGPYDYSSATPGFVVPPVPYYETYSYFGDVPQARPSNFGCFLFGPYPGTYIDPNPIGSVDGLGHNYFRSDNPYWLNSYARFGEVYYQATPDLKFTAGLRWTDDRKRFNDIPSWVFEEGGGYPVMGVVRQEWKEWTGRFNATWTPKLDLTDQTLIYASYARGYKGGGANPPGPQAMSFSAESQATHPLTFNPEFVNAYELGTKNTLFDGGLVVNGDVFYYDYKGYQISQIVDRTSINLNFDAKVKGAELESSWEALPGLRFNFAGGFESTSVNKGQSAIDLMDRTAGHSDWLVVKPGIVDTSNCILPAYVMREILEPGSLLTANALTGSPCDVAYYDQGTPYATLYSLAQTYGVTDFDPATAPNGGAGFSKDLSGNELPNAPHFTTSLSAEYTMPVSQDWAATLHSDFYWQSQSWARIFNDRPYDKLRGYSNVNLALILTSSSGWQVTGYLKNVFNTTAITGAFLNTDDTWLTTNVFVTDPRLFGVRITKNW